MPYVFTEQGIAQLSSVLHSPIAIEVSVKIITVLTLLDKRQAKATAEIYTKAISQQLALDIAKHNAQYRQITVTPFDKTHDRFLCIDNTVYHIGASLKDLGKKWFAFSKMEMSAKDLLTKIL